MATLLIILGGLLLLAALITAFKPSGLAAVAACVSLLCFRQAGVVDVGVRTLIFWAVAALIVLALSILSSGNLQGKKVVNAYVAGGALAGALVGVVISSPGLIIGAVVGAFFGAMAYSRTPSGRSLHFPSRGFLDVMTALGLPAVVTMCIAGLIIAALITI